MHCSTVVGKIIFSCHMTTLTWPWTLCAIKSQMAGHLSNNWSKLGHATDWWSEHFFSTDTNFGRAAHIYSLQCNLFPWNLGYSHSCKQNIHPNTCRPSTSFYNYWTIWRQQLPPDGQCASPPHISIYLSIHCLVFISRWTKITTTKKIMSILTLKGMPYYFW